MLVANAAQMQHHHLGFSADSGSNPSLMIQKQAESASRSGGGRTYSAEDVESTEAAKRQAAEKAAALVDDGGSDSGAAESSIEELAAMSADDKDLEIKRLTRQMKVMKVMIAQDYIDHGRYFIDTHLDGVLDGLDEAQLAACDGQHLQLQGWLATDDEQPL